MLYPQQQYRVGVGCDVYECLSTNRVSKKCIDNDEESLASDKMSWRVPLQRLGEGEQQQTQGR